MNKETQKFNNFRQNLNFYLYKIFYISNFKKNLIFLEIKKKYNIKNIIKILKHVFLNTNIKIIHIIKQQYFNTKEINAIILIKQKDVNLNKINKKSEKYSFNKSYIHICIYIKKYPKKNIYTFHIYINIYNDCFLTFFVIINNLIKILNIDLSVIQYKVQGYIKNKIKHYTQSNIDIQNNIDKKIQKKYEFLNINIYQENIFLLKMIKRKINLKHYLSNNELNQINSLQKKEIISFIWKEMIHTYYGKNTI